MKYESLTDVCKPFKKHETDAGTDLRSTIEVHLAPQNEVTIPLGIKTEIPIGYCALLVPRSGIGANGLRLRNTVGIIDCHFRGNWLAKVKNTSDTRSIKINIGDRIMQAVIIPVDISPWIEVDNVNETERGDGGFGHTGKD